MPSMNSTLAWDQALAASLGIMTEEDPKARSEVSAVAHQAPEVVHQAPVVAPQAPGVARPMEAPEVGKVGRVGKVAKVAQEE